MQFTTNYTFKHMAVGYALSLFQLSTIVSVLLGHKIFKEQDIRKKLIGSAIMIIGSIVIILLKTSKMIQTTQTRVLLKVWLYVRAVGCIFLSALVRA